MEEVGCEVIRGAPKTPAVKGKAKVVKVNIQQWARTEISGIRAVHFVMADVEGPRRRMFCRQGPCCNIERCFSQVDGHQKKKDNNNNKSL